jgi:hypothetical protein
MPRPSVRLSKKADARQDGVPRKSDEALLDLVQR